jgi:hypothetical protein
MSVQLVGFAEVLAAAGVVILAVRLVRFAVRW